MGTMFALTGWLTGGLGSPWMLAWHLALVFSFVTLTFYDIFFQEIPDEISLPTLIIAGSVSYFASLIPPTSLLVGFLAPVLFFGSMFVLSGGRWIGGGDIRLGAIMGFVLGWPLVIVALFIGYLAGSIFSIGGLLAGKLNRKTPIAFGPFLLLGTWITMFWGNNFLDWYLSLI
jgi:prepilin signal peptidase PulO-like enzyme (type II secretory pathway)